MITSPYPVVHERGLPPPERRLLWGDRRDLAELPTPTPGTVLLLRVGDRYVQRRGDGHLRGTEPNVVHATAACLVDTRERLIHVDLSLNSASLADDFTVRAGFRCRVTHPEVVAEAGITDLTPVLTSHLMADLRLPTIGTRHTVDEVNPVRRAVEAQVRAHCETAPPPVTGMDIRFATVEVLTPADLRVQSRRVRDERWRQAVETLERKFEDENIRRLAEHVRGGEQQVAALGIARGEVNIGQLLEQMNQTERRREAQQAELIRILAEHGHTDRVPMNVRPLLDSYFQRIVGASPLATTPPAEDGSDPAGQLLPPGTDEENDTAPRHVPDEDELSG